VRTERQQDVELVLRFIALWQLGRPFQRPPNQTLDEFLNAVVEEQLSQWSDAMWQDAGKAFIRSIEATRSVFGKHAFRKSVPGQRRRPINRGLFESQLVVCGILKPENLQKVQLRRDLVEMMFAEALDSDDDFIQSLLYATGSANASNVRIKTLAMIMNEVIDAEPSEA
jgi:hypothetical protein